MAKKDVNATAKSIISALGGASNISTFTNCWTRFRADVNDLKKIKKETIEKIENVIGVAIVGQQVQVILGQGFVERVTNEVAKLHPEIPRGGAVDQNLDPAQDLATIAAANKAAVKAGHVSGIQQFFQKFSNVFTPLIFGFIGAGVLSGIGGIIQSIFTHVEGTGESAAIVWDSDIALSWKYTFAVMLDAWTSAFIIIVGWRTAQVFGGVPVAGALVACMFVPKFGGVWVLPFISQGSEGFNFLGIPIVDPMHNWLTIGFRPAEVANEAGEITGYSLAYASGSIFGAMMLVFISIPIINKLKEWTPDIVEMVVVSMTSIILLTLIGYFLVIPVSGLIYTITAFLFSHIYSNPLGAGLLAFIFLWAVVFGVHQGFVPVYATLIAELGFNPLLAVLAMGGAGQVGAAIGLYFKADKDSNLRNQIRGAIVPGILGIGEPLIYGVTLIRPKMFLCAMIGAGIGGFYLGCLSMFGITVGLNVMSGPSGILAAPLMIATIGNETLPGHNLLAISLFTSALALAYASGAASVFVIGTKGVDLS